MPGGLTGGSGGGGDLLGGLTDSLFGGGGFGGGGFNTGFDSSTVDPFSSAFGSGDVGDLGAIGDPISQMLMGGGSPMNLGGQVGGTNNLEGTDWQGGQQYGSTDQNNTPSAQGDQTAASGGGQDSATSNWLQSMGIPNVQGPGGIGSPSTFSAYGPTQSTVPSSNLDQIAQQYMGQGQATDQVPGSSAPIQPNEVTTTPAGPYPGGGGTSSAQMTMPFPYGGGSAANLANPATPATPATGAAGAPSPPIGAEEDVSNTGPIQPLSTYGQGDFPQPPPTQATVNQPTPGAGAATSSGLAGTPGGPADPNAPAPDATDPAKTGQPATEKPASPASHAAATNAAQKGLPPVGGKVKDYQGHTWTNIGGGRLRDDQTGEVANIGYGPGGQRQGQGPSQQEIPQLGQQLQKMLPQIDQMLRQMGANPHLINAINGMVGRLANGMSNAPGGGQGGQAPGQEPANVPSEGAGEPGEGEGERSPSEGDGEPPAGGGGDTAFDRPGAATYGSTTAQPSLAVPGIQPHRDPNLQGQGPATETQPSAPNTALGTAAYSPPASQAGGGNAATPSPATSVPGEATASNVTNVNGYGRAGFNPGIARSRARFAPLLRNPQIRAHIKDVMMNEQGLSAARGDIRGPQAVLESMVNRANMRNIPLTSRAASGWTYNGGHDGGYYDASHGTARDRSWARNPRINKLLDQAISNVLHGSDISGGATDNASGRWGLNELQTGKFQRRSSYGGEYFSSPGWGERGLARRFPGWYAQITGNNQYAMQ